MKRKQRVIRWDKIVGYITLIVIIMFAVVVYKDFTREIKSDSIIPDSTASDSNTNSAIKQTSAEHIDIEQTSKTDESIGKICIDAGHGGSDAGYQYFGVNEKDQTLKVALALQETLKSRNVDVVMTRTTDVYLSDEKRVDICNTADCDAIVSIHRNAFDGNPGVYGAEAWIHTSNDPKTYSIADNILTTLKLKVDEDNRGVKIGTIEDSKKNYYINSNSNCPSVMLELGFITSKADEALVTTKINATANAIADGIIEFLENDGVN